MCIRDSLSWISGTQPDASRVYSAKTRYRQQDSTCRIVRCDESQCEIEFAARQWAITPGQSVVLYDGETCLGGGIIEAAKSDSADEASLTHFARTE